MSFFLPSENWEKVIGLYVVFFAVRKLGKKVIGLYVVFYVGRRKTGLGFRVRVRVRV